jgi:hypothetical protein
MLYTGPPMTLGNMHANGVGTQNTAPMLILKRASKSRPGGPWSDDDYDMFDGDQHFKPMANKAASV